MIASKPLASLSSGLLARKGHAKPAMRPQGFHGLAPAGGLEDLGWNDMGGDPAPASASAPAPASAFASVASTAAPLPPVLRQREDLADELAGPSPAPRRGVSLATAQRIGRETMRRHGKAAFTLRLDPDRHLRLRLASAIDGRSAQQLVTAALDRMLDDMTDLALLLDQLSPARKD